MSNKQIKFPSLDGDKVVEQYPLSVAKFKLWLGTFPKAAEFGLDKDKLVYENSLKTIFYYNARSLYEFFDQMGLELVIGKVDTTHWSYHIAGEPHSFSTDSRISAEEMGFQICFETLEKKLS